jgi:MFS family permease
VSRTAPRRLRGSVLGLYAALSAVAGSVGSLLGGWIAARGFVPAFAVAGVLVVAGGAVVLVTRGLSERRAGGDPETPEAATD